MQTAGRRHYYSKRFNLAAADPIEVIPAHGAWRQVTFIAQGGTSSVFPDSPTTGGFSLGIAGTLPAVVQFLIPPDVSWFATGVGAVSILFISVVLLPDAALHGVVVDLQGKGS